MIANDATSENKKLGKRKRKLQCSHVTIDNAFLFFFSLAVGMLFRGGKGEDWSGESNGDCDWNVCESHASAQAGKEDQEAVGVDYA